MAVNTAPPKLSKGKKLGKNKKKAWRAANVNDIKEFLEDEERQVIGGGVVSEKTDDTLFVLDTAPQNKQESSDSKKKKKEKGNKKPLKCLSLLLPDPHSTALRRPDGDSFQKGKRSKLVADLKEQKSGSKVRLVARGQRAKVTQQREERRALKRKLPVVEEDIWAEPADGRAVVTVKPPKRFRRKPSALPPTTVPHPGASVNPAYDDHQALLSQARGVEVGRYRAEQKIYNALDGKFPSKADAPTEADYLVEMAAGLVPSSDDDDDSDAEECGNTVAINPPVRREDRKTRKQRRVELEATIQNQDKKSFTAARQRENMVLRIPTLKSEINKQEKIFKERATKKAVASQQLKFKTKRLGKQKYAEQDLALKLSEELVGSLREVKPEGHVIQDVYKSLQRRNIIEPRIRQKNKRTYKPKVYEKKTHREVTL